MTEDEKFILKIRVTNLKKELASFIISGVLEAYRVPAKFFLTDVVEPGSKNVGRNFFILNVRTVYLLLSDYVNKENRVAYLSMLLESLSDPAKSKDFMYNFGRLLKDDVVLGVRDELVMVKSRLVIATYLEEKIWDRYPNSSGG